MGLVERKDIEMVREAVGDRETRTSLRKHLDKEELPFVSWLNTSVTKIMEKLERKGVEFQPNQTSELGSQIYFVGILGFLAARTAMIRQLGEELGMEMDPHTLEMSLTPKQKQKLFKAGKLPAKYYDFDPEILDGNPTIAKAVERFECQKEEQLVQKHLGGVISPKKSKPRATKKKKQPIVNDLEV